MAFRFTDVRPRVVPPLEADFRPLVLANHAFQAAVQASGQAIPLAVAVERGDGTVTRFDTSVFAPGAPDAAQNLPYVDRLVKTLLWARGGWKVYIGGSPEIGDYIAKAYAPDGSRAFDADIMGEKIYERDFTVITCAIADVPANDESAALAVGGHLEGCRIGFDAGASDRKVAAVIDGEAVYSEEVVWDPRNHTDPQYHFDEIMQAMRTAASHMPRVDAIGVSSAGVYVNNRIMVASLFRGVPRDLFEKRVKGLFLEIKEAWGGIPLEVVNDGEVTALAGAMSLEDTAVIGVAMGSSEAAGYVTPDGNITNWLNELAFVPIDANPGAAEDEWSKDIGCGVQYLSQQAVGRLIDIAGLDDVDKSLGLPEKLKAVQKMFADGDERIRPIYESIGCYLGYALAHYADFYDIKHALILGRVTSGEGGNIILQWAQRVLQEEFPALANMQLHLPDESNRRVGQAIAAASLPVAKAKCCCCK